MIESPIPSEPRRLKRAASVGLVLSFLAAASVVIPVGEAQQTTHNVQIVWDTTPANRIPVVLPFLSWVVSQNSTSTKVACVQPVHITVKQTGDVVPLLGVARGSNACTAANQPCDPYTAAPAVFDCSPGTLFGTGAFFVENPLGPNATIKQATLPLGCLRPFRILIDIDGDGTTDVSRGPQYGFSGC